MTGGAVAALAPQAQTNGHGKEMDQSVQTSCWGVTAKAVIGVASILLLTWLFGVA